PSLSLALQSITPTTLFFFLTIPPPPNSTLFPYTTLFRSRELATLYSAFAAGTQATLPELPIQYVDYAQWQRGWLLGEVLNGQLSYWRKKLGGQLPLLALPYDHARPAVQTFQGGQYRMELPDLLFTDLNR